MAATPTSVRKAGAESSAPPRVEPQTHPGRYRHWKLNIAGPVATLILDVQESGGMRPGYELKLNSYDLGVDIELADAVNRLRFEHPEVSVVVVTSGKRNLFCAGANIFMLGGSSHPFKVNFCKYTNETRLSMEEATAESGQTYIAALNGTTSGGGYELALACREIHLIDDRASAVSLPEVPYLGVLPGTGGLTRLVDKRHVRRDLADVFSTLAEGAKGKRALEWKLVDGIHSPSGWEAAIAQRVAALKQERPGVKGITLEPLEKRITAAGIEYSHLKVEIDPRRRVGTLTIQGPDFVQPLPPDPAQLGCRWYPLALFRELDDALVELRFNYEEIGVLLIKSVGDLERVLEIDAQLRHQPDHWFLREVRLLLRRTLKRLDLTARSIFTLAEPGGCFGGFLYEVALAGDRIYMLHDADGKARIALTPGNSGIFPMGNGLGRLEQRFLDNPPHAQSLVREAPTFYSAEAALEAGLVTSAPDALDWEDEVRVAVEERASLSPDALTGMEASLRFAGPETMETKIFARLSAWQNWIFTRPNATGEKGGLTLYGKPQTAELDRRRT
jgi:benzoyl-CoA-dihydrodiol lyase